MKFRHKLLITFAMAHIGLVMLGATGMASLADAASSVPLAAWYRQLSGADNSYEFFAPSVEPEERVTFIMSDGQGRQWRDDLNLAENREANLSLGTIPFVLGSADDETAWNMMRSMADAMLRRHTSAVTIQVRVEAYSVVRPAGDSDPPIIDFPSMQQYRGGERPDWRLLYELTFSRSGEVLERFDTEGGTRL